MIGSDFHQSTARYSLVVAAVVVVERTMTTMSYPHHHFPFLYTDLY
jgi:hypothetical protein